jgi:hypothetical protein
MQYNQLKTISKRSEQTLPVCTANYARRQCTALIPGKEALSLRSGDDMIIKQEIPEGICPPGLLNEFVWILKITHRFQVFDEAGTGWGPVKPLTG